MLNPQKIELIGDQFCIHWSDGSEDYLQAVDLRRLSPSAENVGEVDLLGRRFGQTTQPADVKGVKLEKWETVGGYGLRLFFSDGHRTGIYTYDYLKEIARQHND